MLDNVNQKTTINAVSGTLVQSAVGSRFIRFHADSRRSEELLRPVRPFINDKPIIILQVMLCPDNYFLIEYIIEESLHT